MVIGSDMISDIDNDFVTIWYDDDNMMTTTTSYASMF
jgi:hypothetical protein